MASGLTFYTHVVRTLRALKLGIEDFYSAYDIPRERKNPPKFTARMT